MLHNAAQQRQGGMDIDPYAPPGAATKKQVSAVGCQRVFWNGEDSKWYKYNHADVNGGNHTVIESGVFAPPFEARAFKVEGANHWVQYDMPAADMRTTREQYAVEMVHPVEITQVWLDPNHQLTGVDAITFYK
jgi:hypothetical protein